MKVTEMPESEKNPTWRPQFTAALLLEEPARLSFRQLQAELKRIAPQAVLGDWTGPITDPSLNPRIETLSLDGERMSVNLFNFPVPPAVLQPGPFPNPYWPNPIAEASNHKAHIAVIGLGDPVSQEAILAKARAVTLVAAAIARLVPAIGVTWADAANLVKAEQFIGMTENIGREGSDAIPFWVRIMLARHQGQDGEEIVGGTLGLRLFGLRELEYAPSPLPLNFIMQHAYTTSAYLIRFSKTFSEGETTGVEGSPIGFRISHAAHGVFGSFPIARLTLVQPQEK